MIKEWVGCTVCGSPFEREIITTTASESDFQMFAVCNTCIRRKDLEDVFSKIIRGCKEKVKT